MVNKVDSTHSDAEKLQDTSKGTWWTVSIGEKSYPSYVQANGEPFICKPSSNPIIVTDVASLAAGSSWGKEWQEVATIYLTYSSKVRHDELHFILWKDGAPVGGSVSGIDFYYTPDGSTVPKSAQTELDRKEAGIYKSIGGGFFLARNPEIVGGESYICRSIQKESGKTVYKPALLNGEIMMLSETAIGEHSDLSEDRVCFWNGQLIRWNNSTLSFSVFEQNGIVFDQVKIISNHAFVIYEYTDPEGKSIRVTSGGKELTTLHGFFTVPSSTVWWCVEFQYGKEMVIVRESEHIVWDNNDILYAQYDAIGKHIGWISLMNEFQEVNETEVMVPLTDLERRFPEWSELPDQIFERTDEKGGKLHTVWCHNPRPRNVSEAFFQAPHGLSVFCYSYETTGYNSDKHPYGVNGDNTSRYLFFRKCPDGALKFAFNEAYKISFLDNSGAIRIQSSSSQWSERYIIQLRDGAKSVFEPIGIHEGHDVLLATKEDGTEVYIRIIRDYERFEVKNISEVPKEELDIDFHGFTMNQKGEILIEGMEYDLVRLQKDNESAVFSIGWVEHIKLQLRGEYFTCSCQDKKPMPFYESQKSPDNITHVPVKYEDEYTEVYNGKYTRWVMSKWWWEDFKEFTDSEDSIIEIREKHGNNVFVGYDNVAYFLDPSDDALYPIEAPEHSVYKNGKVLIQELLETQWEDWMKLPREIALQIGSGGKIERLSDAPEHEHLLVVERKTCNLYGKDQNIIKVYDTRLRQCRVYTEDFEPLLENKTPIASIDCGPSDKTTIFSLQPRPLHRSYVCVKLEDSLPIFWFGPNGEQRYLHYLPDAGGWATSDRMYAAKRDPESGRVDLFPVPKEYDISHRQFWENVFWEINGLPYPEAEILRLHAQFTYTPEQSGEVTWEVQGKVEELVAGDKK